MFNWFVANLVRTLYAKFYQNQPRLVEDITQAFWFTFFGTVYVLWRPLVRNSCSFLKK